MTPPSSPDDEKVTAGATGALGTLGVVLKPVGMVEKISLE